jgi:pilus assembly protein CpaC
MHRTFSVPRLIGWWSLLITLALHVPAVSAQTPLQPANFPLGPQTREPTVINLAVGTSRPCQMTTQADLKRVENPNSRVARVEQVKGKTNEVLLVAANPGKTIVTLTDQNDRVEVCEVVVTAGAVQPQDGFKVLVMQKDEQKNVTLKQPPLGGTEITRNDVVKVVQSNVDPKVFTFIGVGTGKTRITFYFDAKKTQSMTYEVEVPLENRIEQLRQLLKKIAPYDAVEATELQGSRAAINVEGDISKETTVAVLLTGTVAKAETADLIFRAANAIFPPTLITDSGPRGSVNVNETRLDRLNVVNQIRIRGVHHVQLEVVVAVVNRSEARNMASNWSINGANWFASSIFGGPFAFTNILTPSPNGAVASLSQTGTANLPFGIVNSNGSFQAYLSLLRTEGLTKILAEPRVVTLSGRPAIITSGGQTPVLTASGQGAPSVDYKSFGTVVKFLPVVLGNGKIHLEVNPEISNINQAAGITIPGVVPTVVPGFDVRNAIVSVEIEDGQTLAIGGLIQNKIIATISRVPVLGDLPYLSTLFSTKTYTENEEEMIILVTPRLVDPVDCTKIPKYLPGRETRSPSDFEFFLEGIMEAPRGVRNVRPLHLQGPHVNAENIGQIPCGDIYGHRGGSCANGNCGAIPAPTNTTYVPRTYPNSSPSMAMPSFPEPTIPTTSPRISEPELPSVPLPSSLDPVVPTTPGASLPNGQNNARPVLPPIPVGPAGR